MIRSIELVPGDDGAKVDEVGQVDQKIYNVGNMRLFRLLREPSVVGKAHSSSKADQQVVRAKHAARPGAEESKDEVEHEKAFSIYNAFALGKLDGVSADVTNQETVDSTEDTLVKNRVADPVEGDVGGIEMVTK